MSAAREHNPGVTDVAGACSDSSPNDAPALPRWYAIYVMSNAEFVVEDALRSHGIEMFLPTWIQVTQWIDRKKKVARPLFPGYLFARCTEERRPEILRIAGVIEILPSSLKPIPVDAADIKNVRRTLESGLPTVPCPYITGDAVLIDSGPLAGVKGIVQRTKDGTRVVVKIEMLQRAVSVEIDSRDLVKEKKAA